MKLAKHIPLIILSITVLYCIYVAATTNVQFMGKHYWGVGFVAASLSALLINERMSRCIIGITLLLGLFNIIAFTPSIRFYSLGIKINGVTAGLELQRFSLLVSVLFVVLNRKTIYIKVTRFRKRFANSTIIVFAILFGSCSSQRYIASGGQTECYTGLNKIDGHGNPQGYWKHALPDANGHFTIFYEGVCHNGKRIGAWKYNNRDGTQMFRQHIFMDTTETAVQEVNFDQSGKMVSRGSLATLTVKDSIQVMDLKTNTLKWDTVVHRFVKGGFWEYFWPNGAVHAAGHYANDKEIGRWNYFDEQGNLVKTQEFN